MTHQEYIEYLQGYVWQNKRNQALKRFDYRCAICNSPDHLEVHHRTYERLGDEAINDLTVLCADCHRLYSGRMPVWLGWLGMVDSGIFEGVRW